MNTNKINLEYSETQSCFHFNHWNDDKGDWDSKPNTNGYSSIGIADDKTLYRFCKLKDAKLGYRASIDEVKGIWNDFHKTPVTTK